MHLIVLINLQSGVLSASILDKSKHVCMSLEDELHSEQQSFSFPTLTLNYKRTSTLTEKFKHDNATSQLIGLILKAN